MKQRKKCLLCSLMMCMLLFSSCSRIDYSGVYGCYSNGIPVTIKLSSDGSMNTNIIGFSISGTYKVRDNQIVLTYSYMGLEESITGRISNNAIEFADLTLNKGFSLLNSENPVDISGLVSSALSTTAAPKQTAIPVSEQNYQEQNYLEAISLMQEGKYAEARTELLSIKYYRDSSLKIDECYYRLAEQDFALGRYDEAIDGYVSANGFADSIDKIDYATKCKEIVNLQYEYRYSYYSGQEKQVLCLTKYVGFGQDKIEIPYGVCMLDGTFRRDDTGITSITLPETLLSIGDYTFSECVTLSDITLPEKLEQIGGFAFENTAITEITIPASFKQFLYGSCFENCKSLKKVVFLSQDCGVIYQLFEGCTSLTDIQLPSRLITLDSGTFLGCTSLKSIVLPETLENIESEAFEDCSALENIVLPDGLTSIGEEAFRNCFSLTSMVIPKEVEELPYYCFTGCVNLSSIELPANLTYLGSNVFAFCDSLVTLEIPKYVKSFHESFSTSKRTIYIVTPSSYAHRWADEHGYTYVFSKDEINFEALAFYGQYVGGNWKTNEIYAKPEQYLNAIDRVEKNVPIEIVDMSNPLYYKVKYNDTIGYMRREDLELRLTPSALKNQAQDSGSIEEERLPTYSASVKGFAGPVTVKISVMDDTIFSIEIGDKDFRETNGFGAKVLNESFKEQFFGLHLPISVQQIDGIAGATITTKAVVEAINMAYQQKKP